MKFVINTNYDHQSAGYRICVVFLSELLRQHGHEVVHNDWEHYEKYDVALFMQADSQVDKAKKQSPKLLTGIIDPKLARLRSRQEAARADFLMVSSVEQRDAFLKLNKSIFIYYMFPKVEPRGKIHKPKDKILIGYHGNRIHLDSMYPDFQNALSRLAQKYALEFWAVYDIRRTGKWRCGLPAMPVQHIQWEEETYLDYLAQCDIGVVPSKTPINQFVAKLCTRLWWQELMGHKFGYDTNDYILRFKYSSGPGRIPVFSWLGVPVVADLYASSAQVILDGESGFLAHSEEGWYWALEQLIVNHELRNKFAGNSRHYFDTVLSREKTFANLIEFIKKLKQER